METWDAIRARRNVRAYQDRPIEPADLDRILEAGWRSPSASNRQPWDFVVVTDRSHLQALTAVWVGARHLAGAAAAVVMTLRQPEEQRYVTIDQYDLGQATMAMMLSAAGLGIGSCHAGVADLRLARELLGFPEDRGWALLISLGYPADRPLAPVRRPDRRPFEDIVHRGRW